MPTALRLLPALSPDHRARLMSLAREVSFPADGKIFEAGGTADRFWVVRSGTVSLYQKVVGERRISVATLGPGDLLGWSWLFPPHHWDFGAEAFSPVRAYEFDAAEVRTLCAQDPALELSLTRTIAAILAHRLETTRAALIEHYARHGGGGVR
ncbi:cyclic nucleotide-binding domain-containing protein [Streptomyces sp. NBC_00365]|uniref:cyclic nucleotide-binding domain-containing protein n=1 Tax=Streptomyces sp. NBC_00365 TaxID=2975726 RepID=UPI002257487E|nr:cyclic nucleotide-binding domain-containing protein [Streptomyces sp. NBC_00365]MCX5087880.1 cyclic nucleotide-binding domain-containing protein [Streptomyces sp. NBC_00365]